MFVFFFFGGWQFDLVKWDPLRKNPPTVTNYKHQTSFKFKKLPSRKTNNTLQPLDKPAICFQVIWNFSFFFQGGPSFFQVKPNPPFYRLVEKLNRHLRPAWYLVQKVSGEGASEKVSTWELFEAKAPVESKIGSRDVSFWAAENLVEDKLGSC